MKIDLNKKELEFIKRAIYVNDGVYDYENNTDEEFKKYYGIERGEVNSMLSELEKKIKAALVKE